MILVSLMSSEQMFLNISNFSLSPKYYNDNTHFYKWQGFCILEGINYGEGKIINPKSSSNSQNVHCRLKHIFLPKGIMIIGLTFSGKTNH